MGAENMEVNVLGSENLGSRKYGLNVLGSRNFGSRKHHIVIMWHCGIIRTVETIEK